MAATTLKTAWKRQAQWSTTANTLKARYVWWRRVVFGLAILAAVSATLSAELPSGVLAKIFTFLATLCAGLSPIVSTQKVGKKQLQLWSRARSVSEELKSDIFKYLVSRDSDRTKLLNDAQEAALASVQDIVPIGGVVDIPIRAKLEDMTTEQYIQERILGQADGYYFPQAGKNDRMAQNLHRLYFLLMLVAASVAALAGISDLPNLGQWTAVFTTLGASVLAYLAAGRYEYLSLSYQSTGDQLVNLRNRWEEYSPAEKLCEKSIYHFVEDCEAVISNQNQSWHAKIAGANTTV